MLLKSKSDTKFFFNFLIYILIANIGFLSIQFSQSNPIPIAVYEAKFEEIEKWDVILSTEGSSLTRDTTLNCSYENSGKLIGRAVYYHDFTKWKADGGPVSFENQRYVDFGWQFANVSSNYIGIMLNYSDTQIYCVSNFSGDFSNSSSEYWFSYNDTLIDTWYEHRLALDSFGSQLYGVAIINSGYDNGVDLEPCEQITNFAYISVGHVGEGYTPFIALPIIPVIIGLVVIGFTGTTFFSKKK